MSQCGCRIIWNTCGCSTSPHRILIHRGALRGTTNDLKDIPERWMLFRPPSDSIQCIRSSEGPTDWWGWGICLLKEAWGGFRFALNWNGSFRSLEDSPNTLKKLNEVCESFISFFKLILFYFLFNLHLLNRHTFLILCITILGWGSYPGGHFVCITESSTPHGRLNLSSPLKFKDYLNWFLIQNDHETVPLNVLETVNELYLTDIIHPQPPVVGVEFVVDPP